MNFDTGGSVEGSPDSHSKCATPSAVEMLWSEKTRRIVILLFSSAWSIARFTMIHSISTTFTITPREAYRSIR
jgi:hypothetical protein